MLPGLVFATDVLTLLLILLPGWTWTKLSVVQTSEGVGFILATLLASGAMGFIFHAVHHELLWRWKSPAIDFSSLVSRLAKANVIQLVDADTGDTIESADVLDVQDSWAVVTSLWHEHLETSPMLKGSESRSASLTDIIHATGSVRVASLAGWVVALAVAAWVAHFRISLEPEPIIRFAVANLLAALVLLVLDRGSGRAIRLARSFVDEVLQDALLREGERPITTNVIRKQVQGQLPNTGIRTEGA